MQLFLDTANVDEIREANEWGVLDGVTTNPTHVAKTGRPYAEVVEEICKIVDGPISAETIGLEAEVIVGEARELAAIHPNVVVKVPIMKEGLKAVRRLADEGIRTNVTVAFQPLQALLAAKAGAYFISPFIGRLDDISHTGMELIRDIVTIYRNYDFDTQVLVASIRHPLHVLEAAKIGADIASMPFKVFEQLIKHPLTDIGLERFLQDWKKAKG